MRLTESRKELAYALAASVAVAAAIVIGLMIENPGKIGPLDVILRIAFVAGAAAAGTVLCGILYRPAATLFPAAVLVFFQFRTIHGLLPNTEYGTAIAVAALVLVLAGIFIGLRRMARLQASRLVFAVSAAIAGATGLAGAPQFVEQAASTGLPVLEPTFARHAAPPAGAAPAARKRLPDIIYVVPDRYPNRSTLAREYGFDNSAFYRALRARGFRLDEDAWANYPKTFQSLASTLNSGYLDRLGARFGPDSANQIPVYRLIEDNIVQDRLRRAGYRYLHFGNWWTPTRRNRHADVNEQGYAADASLIDGLPESARALLEKTVIPKAWRRIFPASATIECERVKRQLTMLRAAGDGDRPVFLFAHLVVPHPPVLADADGNCLEKPIRYPTDGVSTWPQFKAAYIEFLKFFNREILAIVDAQRRRRARSGRELIFVIQSDEGPFPKVVHDDEDRRRTYDFFKLSDDEVRTKLGILNAVLMPQRHRAAIASLQTPINNWRFIFNAIFGHGHAMLDHRAFIFRDPRNIYEFRDVSDIVGLAGGGVKRLSDARHRP